MEVDFLGIIVVGGVLLCVFLAVVGSVVYAVSKKKLSLGSVVAGLICLVLLLPVAAVMMYFLSYRTGEMRPATPVSRDALIYEEHSDEPIKSRRASPDFDAVPKLTTAEPVVATDSGTAESPAAVAVRPAPAPAPAPERLRPDWIKQAEIKDGDTTLILLTAIKATPERAEVDILQQAAALVRKDFEKHHAQAGPWMLPLDVVETAAIKQKFTEPVDTNLGSVSAVMHRVYAQVELSPEVRQAVYPVWRDQIVAIRLWELGSLLGLITLLIGTVAGYLRIDALTAGAYRGRLKIAAASLIVAGLGAVAVLASA